MGTVYLVGAGPGDPGLLTLRGHALLGQAGAVLYDNLVNPSLLDFAPQAEHVFTGKKAGVHSFTQEEIHRLIVDHAARHGVVVRLKGGDPFIFGRGGEEAAALRAAGISFEVVPGVTAAVAAGAYAGIPLTHRGVAQSVSFITAHAAMQEPLDLRALQDGGSVCFYMGVKTLPEIAAALAQAGRPRNCPVAIIEWATYGRQRTLVSTLERIVAQAEAAGIEAPSILIAGPVVTLREELAWFETRPLHGLRVAVTHAAQRSGQLEQRLRELGAEVLPLPLVQFDEPDPAAASLQVRGFDWIVLTSPNAADAVFHALDQQGLDARALADTRLCVVGAMTQEAVQRRHLLADARPENYESSSVLKAMRAAGTLAGARVLLPRADISRRAVAQALREAGAEVTESVAYRARPAPELAGRREALAAFAPHVITLSNSTAAVNLAALLEGQSALSGVAIASIGPVTSGAASGAGLAVSFEAVRHDIAHLVEAIVAWRRESLPPNL